MKYELLYFYVFIFLLDGLLLWNLTDLVYSFLLSKRNLKGAKKIHKSQSKKDRFTLAYIKNYAIYPEKYSLWYKIRLIFVYSIIPQYLTLAIIYFLSSLIASYVLFILIFAKLIFLGAMRRQFSGKISRFDKRYRQLDK